VPKAGSPSARPSRPWDLSVVVLLAANAIPLIGVLFWGWDAGRIVFLYWFENVVVGAINVLKIIGARGSALPRMAEESSGAEAAGLATMQRAPKAFLVPFFVVHYGMFTLVHGIFLFAFFGREGGISGSGGDPFAGVSDLVSRVFSDGGGWAAVALIASHLYSFGANYVAGGEWRSKSPSQLMVAPYGRVVVLHLAILFGGMAVQLLGNPMPLLLLLVGGKTVLDLMLHWRSHRVEPSAT
jgi:hypothetical protein